MGRVNLKNVVRYSIKKRYSKVDICAISNLRAYEKNKTIWNLLPDILGGKDLKNLVNSVISAKKAKKPVILMMGAHPIKCGLSPLINDLMERGFITAIAVNGACMVHDYEMCFFGRTSEDVADSLNDGSFGMGKETSLFINQTAVKAARDKKGLGFVFGRELSGSKLEYPELSIFLRAYKLGVDVTVHAAIGTDIYFQHPECSGSAVGESSYTDFLKFCESVSLLGEGGVVLNLGSAVIMPEVFLKALNIARNTGSSVKNFTTANFDMIRQYRPLTNVVARPVLSGGRGYSFTGQHELLFPLLYLGITGGLNG